MAFLPPVLWLAFYLYEDHDHPEPKILLLLAFIGGMASALLALLGECFWVAFSTGSCRSGLGQADPITLLLVVALIEEFVKYLPVKFFIMKRRDFDEPIDGMVYMMTSAMGFAALENLLFVLPIFRQNVFAGLEVSTTRFLGANLLHALSSGLVGFFLARAYFSPRRHHFIALGIIIASIFHAAFNYLIMLNIIADQSIIYVVLLLLTMTVMILIDFEKLKKAEKKSQNTPATSP